MRHERLWSLPIALLLCCFLPACNPKGVRPSNAPTPPTVQCEGPLTPKVQDWPEDWLRDGPPWAIGVLGILEEERRIRAEEHRCLEQHRQKGLIR